MKNGLYTTNQHRKPQLHSLIDMAFLLLLFFATLMIFISQAGHEQIISLNTPENKEGEAQIVIQIIDENTFWFLGDWAREEAIKVLALSLNQDYARQLIYNEVFQNKNCKCNFYQLQRHIKGIKEKALQDQTQNYFILIRCPNHLPYEIVIKIIQEISGLENLKYGCVGGSPEELQNAKFFSKRDQNPDGTYQDKLYIIF